jgi:hypothetical protein
MNRLFASFAFLMALQGCSTHPFPPEPSQQNLGKLVVNTPLLIEADRARVSLQAGRVVDRIDRNEPVCSVESWLKGEQSQTIQPDSFRISQLDERQGDISQGFGFYGSNDASMGMGVGFRLGSVGLGMGPLGNAGIGREMSRVAQAMIQVRLVSTQQPNIFRLTCYSAEGWLGSVEVPTVTQINQVLGGIATIDLAK